MVFACTAAISFAAHDGRLASMPIARAQPFGEFGIQRKHFIGDCVVVKVGQRSNRRQTDRLRLLRLQQW